MSEVLTTCPYCGVGCGVRARIDGAQLIAVSGDPHHPANAGHLCVKGTNLASTTSHAGRLYHPLVNGQRVSWSAAIDTVARRFQYVIDQHGPHAVAFYLSGQLLTEDYYVANKLMKGFLGSANVDTNSRLCMSSAVAAHKRAFGEDVVPCSYADLEQCNLIILCGSNAAWTHPIVYQRIAAARSRYGTRVVVIDPRRTSTCDIADQHLQLRPGSDTALFNGLLTYLAENKHLDLKFVNDHTADFDEVLAVNRMTLDQTAQATALNRAELQQFYASFCATPETVTLFSQGVNQSVNGTDKANAIINCHLATGRIGKAGAGPFSITGQPNAMGGREVGGMANQLAAHMDFTADSVDRLRRFWNAPNMASAPGLKAVDMFTALGRQDIQAIWIMGTNPAVSLPGTAAVERALQNCPFVVVSDCLAQTDTTRYADVLLPAQTWGEKDGTVTNSERCISRQRSVVKAPAEARPDWRIVCDVAAVMGHGVHFDYQGVWEIFSEHAALTGFENDGQRQLDLSTLAYLDKRGYDQMAPTSWPLASIPFADGRFSTPDGKARFIVTAHRTPSQQPGCEFSLILNTGRLRDQWHTMTRTGISPKLFAHQGQPRLLIHPQDATRLNIGNDTLVEVYNQLGAIRLVADITEAVQAGHLFAPIHWNDQFAHMSKVGVLVAPVVDPVSGQPESKHAVVNCRPITAAHWLRTMHPERLIASQLSSLQGMVYWTGAPCLGGWQYEVAIDDPAAFYSYLNTRNAVAYRDHTGQLRMLGEENGKHWLLFASTHRNTLPEFAHLHSQLSADLPDWQKLSLFGNQPVDVSPTVCTCFEVSQASIAACISEGARSVDELGKRLGCGTNCGSCIPELNQLLDVSLMAINEAAIS